MSDSNGSAPDLPGCRSEPRCYLIGRVTPCAGPVCPAWGSFPGYRLLGSVMCLSTRGALIGQVWTRHLAPAAPASRPSLPTQFLDCACHSDSALQFLSLPSALNGVELGCVYRVLGFVAFVDGVRGVAFESVPLWCPPVHWHACYCWPLSATYLCVGYSRSWGVGAVRGHPPGPLPPALGYLGP